jgi:hypothetical protein
MTAGEAVAILTALADEMDSVLGKDREIEALRFAAKLVEVAARVYVAMHEKDESSYLPS